MFPRWPDQRAFSSRALTILKNLSKSKFSKRARLNALTVAIVWCVWLVGLGPMQAMQTLADLWYVAVTMTFGSFVAGASSLGGGAVAFPVFTKVLHVSASEAKLFSLAIQSVGMTSAALAIVSLRIPVAWRVVWIAVISGGLGILFGLSVVAPRMQADEVRVCFTAMQMAFAAVLIARLEHPALESPKLSYSLFDCGAIAVLGFLGGIASGLVGSGLDLIIFSYLVLKLKWIETLSTPTSVIIMAANSVTGVVCYKLLGGQFSQQTTEMWLAAVPVVVVGAPLGAYCCSQMSRAMVSRCLLVLIACEVVSTVWLIPFRGPVAIMAIVGFLISLAVFWGLHVAGEKADRK